MTSANNMQSLHDIAHLIAEQLHKPRNGLWDAEDIAAHLCLSKSAVQSHVINSRGFPSPVRLPTGGKRWHAAEVRTWASGLPRATS